MAETIGNFFRDVVENPGVYLLLVAWVVVAWIWAKDNDKSFIGILFKVVIATVALVAFHAITPILFWIVVVVVVIASIIIAKK